MTFNECIVRRKTVRKITSLFKLSLLIPLALLAGRWSSKDYWCSHHTLLLISRFEGFFPKTYLCPAGCSTIGYGHLLLNHEILLREAELTQQQALELLQVDLVNEHDIRPYLIDPDSLEPHQLDALTSLTYNM